MKLCRLVAAGLAALALSACVGGAIVPVATDTTVTYVPDSTVSYYGDRYYYPDGTYFYRY